MRIGLQIPHFRPSTPESMRDWLTRTVQAVDSGGFDSLWVMDHFFQPAAAEPTPSTDLDRGMGSKKTLRLVAQYGDACNFFGRSEDALLQERLDTLQEHCQQTGRPYDAIEKTVLQTADFKDGTLRDVIASGERLRKLGFEHVIFNIKGDYSRDTLASFRDEIIPALKA